MTTAKKTVFGAAWNVFLNFFNQFAALVIYALLARILNVEEFGLIAFCFLITEMMILLGNFGVNQILIQKAKWSERLAANCYWFLLLISIFFALIIVIFIAPLSEHFFYHDSALMLILLATVPVISSFSLVSAARLQRNFQNKTITKINITGTTIGGALSVFLVLNGYGVWSVIIGRVVQSILTTALFIYVDRYVPRYAIEKKYIKYILNFGLPLFYDTVLNFLSQRSLNFTTAFLLGSTQFAFVSVSQRAFRMISEITVTPLNAILLPGFSRLKQGADLTSVYVRVISLASCIIVPMYLGVAILANELVFLVFGPQWHESAILLVLLCFTIVPNISVWFLPSLLISRAQTKPIFRFNVITTILKFVFCGFGALYSVEWSLIGLLIASFISVPVKLFITKKYIEISSLTIIKSCLPATISATVMFAVTSIFFNNYFSDLSIVWAIIFKVLFGVIIYLICMLVLFQHHSLVALRDLLDTVRKKT